MAPEGTAVVKVRRTGVADAKPYFDRLRPGRDTLIELQGKYRPFGPEFLILEAVKKALDTAAHHFTGDPNFYSLRPDQSKVGREPEPRPT